ncbi:MAG: DUF4259 domain-containing protein [Actinomycetota bacterium]
MGAWGEGPFDNDDAGDWAYEFDDVDEATGLQILAEALDLGGSDEYIEAPEGTTAVASAAVVSWLHDPGAIPDSPYGEAAIAWVRRANPKPNASLVEAALVALDRVRSDRSELAELWAESEDVAWRESLAQIETRLRTRG